MQLEPLFTIGALKDSEVHAFPVIKIKIFSLLLVNFLDEYKFSPLLLNVMESNMDYWRQF